MTGMDLAKVKDLLKSIILDLYEICTIKIKYIDSIDDVLLVEIKDYVIAVNDKEMNGLKNKILIKNTLGKLLFLISLILMCLPAYIYMICYEDIPFLGLVAIVFIIYPIILFIIPITTAIIINNIVNKEYLVRNSDFNSKELAVKIKKIYNYNNTSELNEKNIENDSLYKCLDYKDCVLSEEEYKHFKGNNAFEKIIGINIGKIKNGLMLLDNYEKSQKLKYQELDLRNQITKLVGKTSENVLHECIQKDRVFLNCTNSLIIEERCQKIEELKVDLEEKKNEKKKLIIKLFLYIKQIEDNKRKTIENAILFSKNKIANILRNNDEFLQLNEGFVKKYLLNNQYIILTMIKLGIELSKNSCIKLTATKNISYIKQLIGEYNVEFPIQDYFSYYEIIKDEFYNKVLHTFHDDVVCYGTINNLNEKNVIFLEESIFSYTIYLMLFDTVLKLCKIKFKNRFEAILKMTNDKNIILEEIVKQPYLKNKYENYDLLFSFLISEDNDSIEEYGSFLSLIEDKETEYEEKIKIQKFKEDLLKENKTLYFSISDIDNMSGLDFEKFLKQLFVTMGYKCSITKAAQDQGLDLLIEKGCETIGVQAKCYTSSTVGNKAVQEVIAGGQYYNCNKCIVVTNSYFTKQAKELAVKTKVILWDREKLSRLLIDYPVKKFI